MTVRMCKRFFRWRGTPTIAAVLAASCILTIPSPALGRFSRPFIRSLSGTPTGPGGSGVPFVGPGGLTIDQTGNLWVADLGEPTVLDEFSPSGAFLGPGPGPAPLALQENLTRADGLAIDDSTGEFLVTGDFTWEDFPPRLEAFDGSGKLLRRSTEFGGPARVAVDNSSDPLDPSLGSVYVAHGSANEGPPFSDGLRQGIAKVDTSGKPVEFTGSASYIKGNQIEGVPTEGFGPSGHAPTDIAVDGKGNIYALDPSYNADRAGAVVGAVVEFNPAGQFVRAFTGEENPGLGQDREGWGVVPESLSGVTTDPVSGHVLVSITASEGVGAVDEFSADGHFLEQITETLAGSQLSGAAEMTTDASGDLYVTDRAAHAIDVYGPGHFLPTVSVAAAGARTQTSAVLNGAVDPEGLGLSECYFQYVDEAHYHAGAANPYEQGSTTSCEPGASAIPADSSVHDVKAAIGDLTSGVTYRYRLVATTAGALGGIADSSELSFTAPHAPAVESSYANNISSEYADLHAEINPLGAATTYQFEYVDQAHYEAGAADPYAHGSVAPAIEVAVGAGGEPGNVAARVEQEIAGLVPDVTYHVRVVARNEAGATFGPDGAFSTLPRALTGLPDARAYELVTPVNKGSAEDMFALPEVELHWFNNGDVGYSSTSGEEFLLETKAAFGSFAAAGHNAYVFRREGSGWRTLPLASPELGVQSLSPELFDPASFSQIGMLDAVGSVPSAGGATQLSLIGPPGGPYGTIHSEAEGIGDTTHMVGAARGLERVVLETTDHNVLPADKGQDAGTAALYEYERSKGRISLINVGPTGALLRCGAILGQSASRGGRHDAVSADGTKVFFTAPDPYARNMGVGCWDGADTNVPQLYMRSEGRTSEVSLAEAGVSDPSGAHPAVLANAAEDGSMVFFITDGELTRDDAGIHDPELYGYDTRTGGLVRISHGESGAAAGDVRNVPAVSADGSVVYFTAYGKLTANAPNAGGKEHEHDVNLYRYDARSDATNFVASVDARDYPSSELRQWWPTDIVPEPSLAPNASWYTTPDGRYLLFASTKELTGFSTLAESFSDCPIIDSGGGAGGNFGRCSEVYRYDSTSGSIACLSCDPSGAAPVSDAYFGHGSGGGAPAAGPVPALSDDGSKAFFDTVDALVPQDTNGTQDVYEWEAQGSGGCERSSGCLSLISSGQSRAPSFLLGASGDGSNVFFGTHARLVPQDVDEAGDVYDARVNGGFAVAGGSAPCEGNACEIPPPAPMGATPASLTFSGAGNLAQEQTGGRPNQVHKKAKHRKRKRKRKATKRARRARRGAPAHGHARAAK